MEPNESPEGKHEIFHNSEPKLVQASHGKRFGNYIIDLIAFNILFLIVLLVSANFNPHILKWIEKTAEQGFTLTEQLMIIVSYGTYMFIVEASFKGKSL